MVPCRLSLQHMLRARHGRVSTTFLLSFKRQHVFDCRVEMLADETQRQQDKPASDYLFEELDQGNKIDIDVHHDLTVLS